MTLGRGQGLRRKQGLKRSRRPLPPMSPRRRAEIPVRAAVRAAVIERDGGCVGPARGLPGACASPDPRRPPIEVHEVRSRGTHPGSHLVVDLCVALCQRHHDDVDSPSGEKRVRAIAAGLLIRSTTQQEEKD